MCVKVVVINQVLLDSKKSIHGMGSLHDVGISLVNKHLVTVYIRNFSLQQEEQERVRHRKV